MRTYSDASFDEKRGIAGIGVVVYDDGNKKHPHNCHIKVRTINEAELYAIYWASIWNENRGVIYTDSQSAISYIKNEIKDKPRTKEQYVNHMHCVYWATLIRKRGIRVEKIKGHRNIMQPHYMGNRSADLEAQEGRSNYYANNGIVPNYKLYER